MCSVQIERVAVRGYVSLLQSSHFLLAYPPFRLRMRSPSGWANLWSRLTALGVSCRQHLRQWIIVRLFSQELFLRSINLIELTSHRACGALKQGRVAHGRVAHGRLCAAGSRPQCRLVVQRENAFRRHCSVSILGIIRLLGLAHDDRLRRQLSAVEINFVRAAPPSAKAQIPNQLYAALKGRSSTGSPRGARRIRIFA